MARSRAPARPSRARASFDFAAFQAAVEGRDVAHWLAFFDDDAEWIEYGPSSPPQRPRRLQGKTAIGAFLHRVASSGVTLQLSDPVVTRTRAAFALTCTLRDGRRGFEHVILHLAGGRIVRQVDVEAWD